MAREIKRQCAGCRTVTNRTELVRCAYVATTDRIEVDLHHRLPGRGVWVHADSQCLKKAVRSKAIVRTLRVNEISDTASTSAEAMQQLVDDVLQCARCVLQQS